MKRVAVFLASGVFLILCFGCSKMATEADLRPKRLEAAKPCIQDLQAGRFDEAEKKAQEVLARDAGNPQARLVAAITGYKRVMHDFSLDMRTTLMGSLAAGGINHKYMRWSLERTDHELETVGKDLAATCKDPEVILELCLACWQVDWNRNGRVDEQDQLFFQIEQDASGNRIPEGDSRRKPTFLFDIGDVYWGRAWVSFQRALFNLILAYRWTALDTLYQGAVAGKDTKDLTITISIEDKRLVQKARALVLEGLADADEARRLYLAEKDDDREWIPNPRQKNHPLPLPVDEALYSTWEEIVRDLRNLLDGKEGVSVAEAAQLGDHQWANPPKGFIHVGRLFSEPGDIVFRFSNLERLDVHRTREDVERVLVDIFGNKYVPEMKASPMLSRLARMKNEVSRGQETFERKMRYLLWLN
jgi:hypothetical protein